MPTIIFDMMENLAPFGQTKNNFTTKAQRKRRIYFALLSFITPVYRLGYKGKRFNLYDLCVSVGKGNSYTLNLAPFGRIFLS